MNCCSNREIALKAAAHAEQVRIECNISRIAPVDPILLADMRKCEIRFMALPSLEGIYLFAETTIHHYHWLSALGGAKGIYRRS